MLPISEMIAHVDAEEYEKILRAVRRRHQELYPEWELVIVSLERHKDRERQIDALITMLQKQKRQPADIPDTPGA